MDAATVTTSAGTAQDGVYLDAENFEFITDALLLGLQCLGEVEKARIAFTNYEETNGSRPDWFELADPDPADGTALFGDALRTLWHLRHRRAPKEG